MTIGSKVQDQHGNIGFVVDTYTATSVLVQYGFSTYKAAKAANKRRYAPIIVSITTLQVIP